MSKKSTSKPAPRFEAPPPVEVEEFLRSTFPPRLVRYEPEPAEDGTRYPVVNFLVRPLQVNEFHRISDAVVRVVSLYYLEKLPIAALCENALDEVVTILDTLTTIEGHEDLKVSVGRFDIACLPLLLGRFMESISPKKWQALGATFVKQFGLTSWVEEIKGKLTSAATQSNPSNE